jgi:sugar lactone lactonase YvrE
MHRIIGLSLIFCLAGYAAGPSWIEEYATESAAANKACNAKEYDACRQHLLRLRELLDGRVDIVYRLAKVEAKLGNTAASLSWLTIFSKAGLPFAAPASDPDFASLRGGADFEAILKRLEAAQKPVSASTLFLTLPEKDLVAEDIAYDPVSRRFFISSVRHRKILALDKNGKATEFLSEGQPGIWAVLALAVDAKRRYLWASTAAMPEALGYDAANEGRSALLKYSLDSGALLKRYDLPADAKHALGDMTVSAAGDVYVSDGLGAVYWVDHNHDLLETLAGKGIFRSPQTPALSADGRKLFVPDYSRGIGIVDLAAKDTKLLQHPAELSLGGIDGLYLSGTTMLAIQNGTSPERVIRMLLDATLTRVLTWETIEANWKGLGDPTHGVVVGDEFYFIANSGWDQFGDDGALKQGSEFTPPVIRRMRLNGIARPVE